MIKSGVKESAQEKKGHPCNLKNVHFIPLIEVAMQIKYLMAMLQWFIELSMASGYTPAVCSVAICNTLTIALALSYTNSLPT